MWIFRSCTLVFNYVFCFNLIILEHVAQEFIYLVEQNYCRKRISTWPCWSTRFDIIAACLSMYCTVSNHPVSGSIIVKDFSMGGLSWPSILILYRPIISTNNLSHGMVSAFLAVNFTYLNFCFLFLWQVLQTLMWACMSSLNSGH